MSNSDSEDIEVKQYGDLLFYDTRYMAELEKEIQAYNSSTSIEYLKDYSLQALKARYDNGVTQLEST